MANGSGEPSATALVGMEGFVVKSQIVHDGEHWLLVQTTQPSRWCPSCAVAGVGNGRRRVVVRDLPIAGVPTVLVWDKRTFRCREQLCPRSSWSETSPLIAVRASLTERARAEICRRVGHDLDTVAEVAREFGVGWGCAHQAVIDHGDALIAADMRVERTVGVGVDEHTFQHANARRRTQMAITFVDIDRARLLDVVPGRSGDVVREWVTERPDGWAEQVRVATIDAFRGYATAIGDVLAAATLVIDHFHAIRHASTTCAAACNRPPSVIAGTSTTRSTGSAGCCCAPGTTCANEVGNASAPGSPLVIPTAKSPPCGSPASSLSRSTPPPIWPTPSGV